MRSLVAVNVALAMAFAAVVVLGTVMSAQATTINLDFSTSPTAAGFTKATQSWMADGDTMLSGGAWNVNLPDRDPPSGTPTNLCGSAYFYNSLPTTFTDSVVTGSARIAFSGGSSNIDDRTLVFLSDGAADTGYAFSVAFIPGAIKGYQHGATNYTIAVSNNDNAFHTYGWSLDRAAGTLSLSFDGGPVGLATYNVKGNWAGDTELYFGDATGGSAHAETWDSWSLTTLPEPSTLVLLVTGLLGLVCYAWRKRN